MNILHDIQMITLGINISVLLHYFIVDCKTVRVLKKIEGNLQSLAIFFDKKITK